MRRRASVPVLAVLVLALGAAPALADHQQGHLEPQGPSAVRFAADFPELTDDEWGFRLGGFGGIARDAAMNNLPVILVHGNNVDAADWYPVRDDFLAAGWTDQEVWALSYNGLGGNNGTALQRTNPERDQEHRDLGHDGTTRVTANDVNVPDLERFIRAVLAYTDAPGYHLVGHSLGVTLARKTLLVHPDLADPLVSFVAIAGANDGTTFCPPGSEGVTHSCDEIAAGTPWLAELNGPAGELETYGETQWLTVYDGTGLADPAYVGPTYSESPMLLGAENVAFPGAYHNDLRIREDIVAFYREFIEQAEDAWSWGHLGVVFEDDGGAGTPPASATATLPATGGPVGSLLLAGAATWFLGARVRRRG